LLKLAHFLGDGFARDTTKAWLQVESLATAGPHSEQVTVEACGDATSQQATECGHPQ
jgi:hypothetical protein